MDSKLDDEMNKLFDVYDKIIGSEKYQNGIKWGKPRSGHQEGTIEKHIEEIENNLHSMEPNLDVPTVLKLDILTHVHDTFKGEATEGVAIVDPRSHASLAAEFLAECGGDENLVLIVQYHDEPFAIFRNDKKINHNRLEALISKLGENIDLFMLFNAIDNVTDSKKPVGFLSFYEYAIEMGLLNEETVFIIDDFLIQKGIYE